MPGAAGQLHGIAQVRDRPGPHPDGSARSLVLFEAKGNWGWLPQLIIWRGSLVDCWGFPVNHHLEGTFEDVISMYPVVWGSPLLYLPGCGPHVPRAWGKWGSGWLPANPLESLERGWKSDLRSHVFRGVLCSKATDLNLNWKGENRRHAGRTLCF